MVLKSPPSSFNRLRKDTRKRRGKISGTRDLVTGGVTALLGTALLSSTAGALSKL